VSAMGGVPVSDWPPVPPTPLVSGSQSVPLPAGRDVHCDGAHRGGGSVSVASEPGVEPCPQCRLTVGVRVLPGTSAQMRGWSCALCRARWWIGGVGPGPQRFLDLLSAEVELAAARSVLREIRASG